MKLELKASQWRRIAHYSEDEQLIAFLKQFPHGGQMLVLQPVEGDGKSDTDEVAAVTPLPVDALS